MVNKKIPLTFTVILCVGALIALPVRVYELFNLIDPQTGFYTENSATSIILYAVSAVIFISSVALGLCTKKSIEKARFSFSGGAAGAASIILALGFVFACYSGINDFLTLFKEYNDSAAYLELGKNATLTRSGAIDKLGEGIFAGVCAVYFLLFAVSRFKKTDASKYKLLALAPVVWCVFRIVFRFMRTISYVNVSELFYELTMNVFVLMFFMAFAQIMSHVNSKGLEWKLFGYGVPAAFFSLICFLPRLILTLAGEADLISDGSKLEIGDGAIAVFIIIMLISALSEKKRKDASE